ncbi:MAG: hypothetical protein HOW73_42260 [Polyangiaceae bacterium]|nr:hypothetical protein [Polyangiaceae bacterium]
MDAHSTWARAPLPALIEHISSEHHARTRSELSHAAEAVERLAVTDAEREPRLIELARRLRSFAGEMRVHMHRESSALFPALATIERPLHRDVSTSIRIMQCDHDEALQVLKRLRTLTDHYTPPPGASRTFVETFAALARVDAAVVEAIDLENELLYGRLLTR